MDATLVHNNGRQRFYKLSEPIKKGISDWVGPIDDICEDVTRYINMRIKMQFRDTILAQFTDGVQMVCISDAHTHIERLAFPAFYIPEDNIYSAIALEIDGKHTNMSLGGDPRAVYPDEVYLRHLCQLNHKRWEGFKEV